MGNFRTPTGGHGFSRAANVAEIRPRRKAQLPNSPGVARLTRVSTIYGALKRPSSTELRALVSFPATSSAVPQTPQQNRALAPGGTDSGAYKTFMKPRLTLGRTPGGTRSYLRQDGAPAPARCKTSSHAPPAPGCLGPRCGRRLRHPPGRDR